MDLKNIKTFEELKQAKAKFYGKDSQIKKLQMEIRNASSEDRIKIGKKISSLKIEAENAFENKQKEIELKIIEKKINSEWVDVSYPISNKSSLHPLTLVENRFRKYLTSNGFYEVTGSEIETDEFNFEKLNIPKYHPARAMQDSIYINKNLLLRTHNTGFSARELAKNKNKAFAQFSIGPVYRNDEDDATHSHQFTQLDLVNVGHVNFPQLISLLRKMISYVLETDVKIRLRPSFFPFTEPSCEVDIFYKDKWIEVLGSGMFHDNVLKAAGYTNDMSSYAAGIGIERITMIKYGIKDIREFYKNDLRFISQFKGGR